MTRTTMPPLRSAKVLLALAVASCAHDEPARQCSQKNIAVDLDRRSDVGTTARELLRTLEGTRTLAVQWEDRVARTSQESAVSAELDIVADATRPVRLNLAEPASPTATAADCPDMLNVPVLVRLTTDDGSFDESGPAILVASTGSQSTLFFDISPEALEGSYDTPEPSEKPLEFGFRLRADFDANGRLVRSALRLDALWCGEPPCIARKPGDERARGQVWPILQLVVPTTDGTGDESRGE